MTAARTWIGTSGWSYKHWENGKFYPPRMKPTEFLPFFAEQFPTVEINLVPRGTLGSDEAT